MSDNDSLRSENFSLLQRADIAYFATVGDNGYPQVRAMMNLRNSSQFPNLSSFWESCGSDFLTYFVCDPHGNKMRHISSNPCCSAYYCDPNPSSPHGLLLAGSVEVISDSGLKNSLWHDDWRKFYKDGMEDPNYCVICLKPTCASGWYKDSPYSMEIPCFSCSN